MVITTDFYESYIGDTAPTVFEQRYDMALDQLIGICPTLSKVVEQIENPPADDTTTSICGCNSANVGFLACCCSCSTIFTDKQISIFQKALALQMQYIDDNFDVLFSPQNISSFTIGDWAESYQYERDNRTGLDGAPKITYAVLDMIFNNFNCNVWYTRKGCCDCG